jgi:hypothetical protein
MKFRLLLWAMGLMMARASRNNPAFAQQLKDKDLVFQLHFTVRDQRVTSSSGSVAQPAFAIAFRDAGYGYDTLQASNEQLAFMQGIQDKHIQIKGNPALVVWFQGAMKYLKPKKR